MIAPNHLLPAEYHIAYCNAMTVTSSCVNKRILTEAELRLIACISFTLSRVFITKKGHGLSKVACIFPWPLASP
jgi:hypothetical protein